MKKEANRLFPSKILLFGEYSLMFGSMALSIPFPKFNGQFVYDPGFNVSGAAADTGFQIEDYLVYLEAMDKDSVHEFTLDTDRLRKDISNGLVFKSNIPISYGLGSSGALVAAIYDRYGNIKQVVQQGKINQLKNYLAKMESYFHGKSSGLDPLLSYLDHPLLINEKGDVEQVSTPEANSSAKGAMFLIDSQTSSETQPLVDRFVEKCNHKEYSMLIHATYIPMVNTCINAYLEASYESLLKEIQQLSAFQLIHFSEMIPDHIKALWEKGIDTDKYALKLCGSGGGGMVLCIAPDYEIARRMLEGFQITQVHPL